MIRLVCRTRMSWPAPLLLLIGAQLGDTAEPRPSGMRPLDKDATLDNAFAALGADTIPDGRLFAPFYDYEPHPHILGEVNRERSRYIPGTVSSRRAAF